MDAKAPARGARGGKRHDARALGSGPCEAQAFLDRYPDLPIDIILTDSHGIGRGKTIRRHELAGLYTSGRGMPASLSRRMWRATMWRKPGSS